MSSGPFRVIVLAARSRSAAPARARRLTSRALVHPIYAHLPDTPEENSAKRAFAAAALRYRLGPVEVVDVPGARRRRARPRWPGPASSTRRRSRSARRCAIWTRPPSEAVATGGAGFSTDELSDLYLFRAMATARADWKATAAAPPTDERTRAYADYLRAAALTPARKLNPREIPPQVIADFARAVEEVRQRPRGTLTVTGPADAQVALDGGAPMPVEGGVVLPRPRPRRTPGARRRARSRAAGARRCRSTQPTLDVDIPARARWAWTAPPPRRTRGAWARSSRWCRSRRAARTRPIGAAPDRPVRQGARRGAGDAAARRAGLLDAAVMRLDETARRLAQADAQSGTPAPWPRPATPARSRRPS